MTRREGRHHYQSEARQPRVVRHDFADRCATAAMVHEAHLSAEEEYLLAVIAIAHEAGKPVTKADIDRAAGILGRLNANG